MDTFGGRFIFNSYRWSIGTWYTSHDLVLPCLTHISLLHFIVLLDEIMFSNLVKFYEKQYQNYDHDHCHFKTEHIQLVAIRNVIYYKHACNECWENAADDIYTRWKNYRSVEHDLVRKYSFKISFSPPTRIEHPVNLEVEKESTKHNSICGFVKLLLPVLEGWVAL